MKTTSGFKAKPCKCGSLYHTSMLCPRKERKPLQNRKPMKKVGRIGKALIDQAHEFWKEQEPPYLCVYCLVIGYENFLEPQWANVEHGESKYNHPDRRFDKTNLYVSCRFHNKDKGRMDIDPYIAKLKKEHHVT